jgi:hypothetical protein
MNRSLSRLFLASLFGMALFCGTANADLVGTDQAAAPADPAAERERVRAYMERPDVVKQLQEQGVSPEQAQERVRAMSDAEVHAVAQKLDALPAGGRISNTELVIIILLAVIIVILVL